MKTTILLLAVMIGTASMATAQDKQRIILPQKPDLTKKVPDNLGKLREIAKVKRHTGRIIETSFADRVIRIRKGSGEQLFITIPATVSIAGRNVNVHRDSAAFRRAFKADEYIIAFENRRISPDKIEAQDIVRADGFWSRVGN